jgi:hypothetical protein
MPRPNIYQLPTTDLSRQRPKLIPLSSLTKAECRAFNYLANQNPHLGLADVLLLEALAISFCRTMAAKREGSEIWERENRILLAIATKLRCTVQATVQPRSAARRRAEQQYVGPRPWELPNDKDDK